MPMRTPEGWQKAGVETNMSPGDNARQIPDVFKVCDGFIDMADYPKAIGIFRMRYARLPPELGAPDTFLIGPEEGLDRVRINPERMADGNIEIGFVEDKGEIFWERFMFKTDPSGRIPEPIVAYGGARRMMRDSRDTWPVKEMAPSGSLEDRFISVISVGCEIARDFSFRTDRAINFIIPTLRTPEEALARIQALGVELREASAAYQDGEKDLLDDILSIPCEQAALQNFVDGVYPDARAIRAELDSLPEHMAEVSAKLQRELDSLCRRTFPRGMSAFDTRERDMLQSQLRSLAARRSMCAWLLHEE
jgi:hypothetical protein